MAHSEDVFALNYSSPEELAEEIKKQLPIVGKRLKVRVGRTDYVFTYKGGRGDLINGVSALNGRFVLIDIVELTLTEYENKPSDDEA